MLSGSISLFTDIMTQLPMNRLKQIRNPLWAQLCISNIQNCTCLFVNIKREHHNKCYSRKRATRAWINLQRAYAYSQCVNVLISAQYYCNQFQSKFSICQCLIYFLRVKLLQFMNHVQDCDSIFSRKSRKLNECLLLSASNKLDALNGSELKLI